MTRLRVDPSIDNEMQMYFDGLADKDKEWLVYKAERAKKAANARAKMCRNAHIDEYRARERRYRLEERALLRLAVKWSKDKAKADDAKTRESSAAT